MPETVTFDHYEVLTRDDGSLYELGRGAMGITYKAFDTNLRIPVALKVINTVSLDSDLARQRFIREARSAAKLRHRHVASVFHLGMEGDTYFYAMEFIDGETVEALIRRQGALSPMLALRIALQVCRALNAAQTHGLIHRDIKPSNLMLIREDDELCVKVIDFGLAKSNAPGEPGEDTSALSIGGFIGTPHFASPEQLEEKEIDVRSDIYSLGVTLWYMLAGQTPFSGSMAQVMSKHLTSPPPFEQLELPPPVADLLRKMLEKDPVERHQTPAELRQHIEQCIEQLAGGPVAAAARAALEEQDVATHLDIASSHAASETQFEVGHVVAGRYSITEALGESNTGRLFRAHDRDRKSAVRLLVLNRELTHDRATYTQIEREVERIAKVEHPNLLQICGLETVEGRGVVVLEWTSGFTLLEVLRARRELRASEVLPLLSQAAAGVDHALGAGLRRLDLALHQVFVHFSHEPLLPKERLLREPVSEWPDFQVKLNPLGITRELTASETWAGGQTVVGGVAAAVRAGAGVDPRAGCIQTLAAIAYELLGGNLPPLMTSGAATTMPPRYTPLANLTEEGNEVLKRALDPARSFASATEFHRTLENLDDLETKHHDSRSIPAHAAPPIPPLIVPKRIPEPAAPATAATVAAGTRRSMPGPRHIPVKFVGGVLTVLAIGAVTYFLVHSDDREKLTTTAEPTPSQAIQETPPPVEPIPAPPVVTLPVDPPAVTTPARGPSDSMRQDQLKAAVANAERVEKGGDWPASINAWIEVVKAFPDYEVGKVRLEELIERMRKAYAMLSEQQAAELRGPLTDAAELEIFAAMMFLGESLRDSDPTAAFRWLSSAAEKGHASALTQAGLMLANGAGTTRNLEKAAEFFLRAAEKGDVAAQAYLAECYLYGKGVPKDEKRAVALLEEAAGKENVRAMSRLGTCYHQGVAVKQDFAEALSLFTRASDLGYHEATGNLGVLYMNGEGVPRNPKKAVELFRRGAEGNDPYSMVLYARCLEEGLGLEKNLLQAQRWYKKGAEAGHPRAVEWCRKNGIAFTPKKD
jgi:serine/threonine protein kinase/TPR repeat protein